MFVRVKSKATGHQFDIQEHRFDETKHSRVGRVPPSKHPRRTKFNVGKPPTFSVSPVGEEGVTDGSGNS